MTDFCAEASAPCALQRCDHMCNGRFAFDMQIAGVDDRVHDIADESEAGRIKFGNRRRRWFKRVEVGREMSKVERWWYGDEGVEKYYDIGEKLGAGAFAEVRAPPTPSIALCRRPGRQVKWPEWP